MIAAKNLPDPADRQPVRRALLSTFDKTGLAELGARLAAQGVELVSTGGTARVLREAGLEVRDVADLTRTPELLGGRVKTLHPTVHAGILHRRNDPEDRGELEAQGIGPIDLVVVNLYPFRDAVAQEGVTDAEAAENIDIGGPTMLRAAAKNFAFTAAVVDPADYGTLADEIEAHGGTALATRRWLAQKTFAHTAAYDGAIAAYLDEAVDEDLKAQAQRLLQGPSQALRYGENPHQEAVWLGEAPFETLHGKALSFNNLLDVSAALALIGEFAEAPPTVAILKHTNPCGVGQADTLEAAYRKAFATDQQSPFGGIVAVNRPLDRATAEAIDAIFTEVIIAPAFEEGVLAFLKRKKNRRLVQADPSGAATALDVRTAAGGLLVQRADPALPTLEAARSAWSVATARDPSDQEWADLDFAWRVVKHVKSNAIVYAKEGATLGIGAGQMSRIDASEIAVAKAAKSGLSLQGCVVASDAFFPFADGLEAAAEAGAVAAVQPGGSVRDADVVAAADARALAMVFTGRRHFRH